MLRQLSSILLLCAFEHDTVNGQKVMRLSDARTSGLTTEHMDSLYIDAINVQDSTKSAFPGRSEEFVAEFQKVLQAIGDSLHARGFRQEKDVRMTYRAFFSADGRIDHFHYQPREPLPAEQEAQFQRILASFAVGHRFPMQAEVPFKQCGSVTFRPKKEP